MRLAILDSRQRLRTKLLFALIRTMSRRPVPDVVKVVSYRPDFFGVYMKRFTHEAMRGPSSWSVADRELIAAFVSQANGCEYCTKAHAAVSARAAASEERVRAALANPEAVPQPLRATLRMLGSLSHHHVVRADEMREVLNSGASLPQIEDALAISFAFNTMNRLADAFEFHVPDAAGFEAGAKYLLARGYR